MALFPHNVITSQCNMQHEVFADGCTGTVQLIMDKACRYAQ